MLKQCDPRRRALLPESSGRIKSLTASVLRFGNRSQGSQLFHLELHKYFPQCPSFVPLTLVRCPPSIRV
jgi:hypothetical protein